MNQQRWNEQVETVVNTHSEAIDELKDFQLHLERDKGANALMEMHERQMASAGTYINLILVAGYAGFFGLWSTLSPKLPPRLYALCGLLAVLSLVLLNRPGFSRHLASSLRNAFQTLPVTADC
ncbi:hypothetical protein P3C29_13410 [Pseudomonas sp. 1912-s]|uniref:hypothetical protein n=1 Tax=Pseudomonas sp. 1912-s TaxID=3033802 RepID=UPI0023DFD00B|nr:hypothetical protein [Pseudomonas sp. 1912-s]MDF3199681.1 hypothetical protein [Pseudomonas sp. 1912-s]